MVSLTLELGMSGNATPSKSHREGGRREEMRKQERHMTAQCSNFMSAHKLN